MGVKVEVVSSAREAGPLWLQSVPDPFDAAEGRDAADRALADARAVLLNIKLKFAGTIPPAPWPATPEVQKSIDAMQIARDFFETMVAHPTEKALRWHHADPAIKVGPTFVGLGRQLYTQLADLEDRAGQSQALPDLLKLIPSPAAGLRALPTLVAVGLGLVAWMKWKEIKRAFEA